MAGRQPPPPATGSSLSFLGESGDRSVRIVRTHPARGGELRRPLWFVAALSVFGTASSPRPSRPSEPVGGNRTSRPAGPWLRASQADCPRWKPSPPSGRTVCVCLKLLDEDYEKQRLPRPGGVDFRVHAHAPASPPARVGSGARGVESQGCRHPPRSLLVRENSLLSRNISGLLPQI